MLHLIWAKYNTSGSAEEAKEAKGVRQKLLDCYRGLYFEAIEGLQPKEQVSRIAKNLVECVIPPLPFFSGEGSYGSFIPLGERTRPLWLN